MYGKVLFLLSIEVLFFFLWILHTYIYRLFFFLNPVSFGMNCRGRYSYFRVFSHFRNVVLDQFFFSKAFFVIICKSHAKFVKSKYLWNNCEKCTNKNLKTYLQNLLKLPIYIFKFIPRKENGIFEAEINYDSCVGHIFSQPVRENFVWLNIVHRSLSLPQVFKT